MDFDVTSAYHGGNRESTAANTSLIGNKNHIRHKVRMAVQASGKNGVTCDDVEHLLGMSHQTTSARFTELKAMGYIHGTITRPTRSGRNARVYVAKEHYTVTRPTELTHDMIRGINV